MTAWRGSKTRSSPGCATSWRLRVMRRRCSACSLGSTPSSSDPRYAPSFLPLRSVAWTYISDPRSHPRIPDPPDRLGQGGYPPAAPKVHGKLSQLAGIPHVADAGPPVRLKRHHLGEAKVGKAMPRATSSRSRAPPSGPSSTPNPSMMPGSPKSTGGATSQSLEGSST
jgi:hypothetical protein